MNEFGSQLVMFIAQQQLLTGRPIGWILGFAHAFQQNLIPYRVDIVNPVVIIVYNCTTYIR